MTDHTRDKKQSTSSRRVRAILAGGLVLGVGATVTLAAWNDSEFARGTFTAATFDLEGSTTSGTAGFGEHPAAGSAAALGFTVPFSNMSPASVVYAPFWVRLAANTTTAANLSVASIASSDTSGTNSNQLSYKIYKLAGVTDSCDAPTVASLTAIASGTTLASGAVTSTTVPLAIGSPVTAAGAAANLCFVVTAAAGLGQAGVTTATWQLTATSTS